MPTRKEITAGLVFSGLGAAAAVGGTLFYLGEQNKGTIPTVPDANSNNTLNLRNPNQVLSFTDATATKLTIEGIELENKLKLAEIAYLEAQTAYYNSLTRNADAQGTAIVVDTEIKINQATRESATEDRALAVQNFLTVIEYSTQFSDENVRVYMAEQLAALLGMSPEDTAIIVNIARAGDPNLLVKCAETIQTYCNCACVEAICENPAVTETPTGTPTKTTTPTATITAGATVTISRTQTPTLTPTGIMTPGTPVRTQTPVATFTKTRTPTPTTPPDSTPTRTSTPVPPTETRTSTPVLPTETSTNTPVPPTETRTNTPVPPTETITSTTIPPTETRTPVPPTETRTNTPVPPTETRTSTPVPPTETRTNTPVPPTETPTIEVSNTPAPTNPPSTETPHATFVATEEPSETTPIPTQQPTSTEVPRPVPVAVQELPLITSTDRQAVAMPSEKELLRSARAAVSNESRRIGRKITSNIEFHRLVRENVEEIRTAIIKQNRLAALEQQYPGITNYPEIQRLARMRVRQEMMFTGNNITDRALEEVHVSLAMERIQDEIMANRNDRVSFIQKWANQRRKKGFNVI